MKSVTAFVGRGNITCSPYVERGSTGLELSLLWNYSKLLELLISPGMKAGMTKYRIRNLAVCVDIEMTNGTK